MSFKKSTSTSANFYELRFLYLILHLIFGLISLFINVHNAALDEHTLLLALFALTTLRNILEYSYVIFYMKICKPKNDTITRTDFSLLVLVLVLALEYLASVHLTLDSRP
jgi:hypothetical protein